MMRKIFIVILVPAFCAVGFLGIKIYLGMSPSDGPGISEYKNPQKALMVIDIQEDYTGKTAQSPFPYRDSTKLIKKLNGIIIRAVKNGIIVIYIKQVFTDPVDKFLSKVFIGNTTIDGTPGSAFDSRLYVVSDNIFSKNRGDAFSSDDLNAFLIKKRVNELYLAGLDGEACVLLTARGALNRNFRVNIITDAVAVLKKENKKKLMDLYSKLGINLLTITEF